MKAATFPGKFYLGSGAMEKIGEIAERYGAKKPMVIWGKHAKKATEKQVLSSLDDKGLAHEEFLFTTDCTKATAKEISEIVKEKGCDFIIGIGGGKALDMSKAVANFTHCRNLIAPTIAASDAPTSACTVWYDDQHTNIGFDMWPVNPDVVLIDPDIIVKAPERYLKAGIADALATNIEAKASAIDSNISCAGGTPTASVMALAQLCQDILMTSAEDALLAIKAGKSTPAFEKVLEAIVLLSGIGWESGGLATAHTIGNGLPDFEETHNYMHGEKVSFGIVTELVLDPSITPEEREKVVSFMVRLGLPVCFADLNMEGISEERLMKWCEVHTAPGSFTNNHCFPVTAQTLFNAMTVADVYGREMKNR